MVWSVYFAYGSVVFLYMCLFFQLYVLSFPGIWVVQWDEMITEDFIMSYGLSTTIFLISFLVLSIQMSFFHKMVL